MTHQSRIRCFAAFLCGLVFLPLLMAQGAVTPVGHASHVVNPFGTQMSLSAIPQTLTLGGTVAIAVNLTRTGNPAATGPSGNVTFTVTTPSGASISMTAPIQNGVASWTNNQLPVGVNTLVAAYPGDTNYTPVLAQTSVTVQPSSSPDFDFTFPSPVTTMAGQTFNGNIAVQSLNGFSGGVTFTVGQLPKGVTFTLPATSLSKSEEGALSVPFVIGTSATVVTTTSSLLILGVLGIRRRRSDPRKAYILLLVLLGCGLTFMVGCGSNQFLQSNGTQPGTYTIPITGTSGGLTHTKQLTLVVTPSSN